ncbi:MAG: hypothetical protein HYW50_00595 [Candidatus Diapherotrites archaeon]|nr:hypothetical protein [Candidatus Diapherotrites archaeon]
MGTTTIFTRHNDLKNPLDKMTKKELQEQASYPHTNNKTGSTAGEHPLNCTMETLTFSYGGKAG